jgi:hypothetical protein
MGNLGTVLDKLSLLFSKYFLIGSYFPVLVFLSVNGAFLYATSPIVRKWLEQGAAQQATSGAELLVAAAVFAFLLSTTTVALRQWLESLPMLPGSLRKELSAAQTQKRFDLTARLDDLRSQLRELPRRKTAWHTRLAGARDQGTKVTTRNAYSKPPSQLEGLVGSIRRGERPSYDEVEKAVNAFAEELKKFNVDEVDTAEEVPGVATVATGNKDPVSRKKSAAAIALDRDEVALRAIIDQLPRLIDSEAVRIYNDIQFNFAVSGPAAPTRMGNIALSVQSYFGSRYNLNFNFFWTRIQKSLGGEAQYFSVLESAKAQLDFHVALFWLSCAFGLVWTPVSAWSGFSIRLLLAAAIGAPLAAWLFYELAVQSYRSYADLLRTAVDLYHFKLMESLHLKLPPSSNDERQMWKEVSQWLDQGDYLDVAYKHPAAS